MVGKYASNCALEIQKIKMVIHIFVGFALFAQLMWVYHGVESLRKSNNVPFDLPTNECSQTTSYCPS